MTRTASIRAVRRQLPRDGVARRVAAPSPATALLDLGRRAAAGIGTGVLASLAVEQAGELLDVPCVALLEYHDGVLVPLASQGWPGPIHASLVDEARPEAGVKVTRAEARNAGVHPRSLLASALTVGGRPWAVLAVHAPAGTVVEPDDAAHLGLIAHLVATAEEAGPPRTEPVAPFAPSRLGGRGPGLESELLTALNRAELLLHYQPVVLLEGGSVTDVEALIRWDHPTRGLVPPAAFIPEAERSPLIVTVGEWVLQTACRQARQWADQAAQRGEPAPGVAVNLSLRQVADPHLVRRVEAALDSSGLPPEQLTLEITETVLMADSEEAPGVIGALKDLGVRLSIDDFGTGYASLSYLKRFPVDTLKIDRSFVSGLGADPDDRVIVGAIIRLADALGIATVAEGVESDVQARELSELGCLSGQGYLFAPPAPAAASAPPTPVTAC